MDNECYATSNKWGKVPLKAVSFPHQISRWSTCMAAKKEENWRLLLYVGFSEAIYLERQQQSVLQQRAVEFLLFKLISVGTLSFMSETSLRNPRSSNPTASMSLGMSLCCTHHHAAATHLNALKMANVDTSTTTFAIKCPSLFPRASPWWHKNIQQQKRPLVLD